jgi:hypothetical protein
MQYHNQLDVDHFEYLCNFSLVKKTRSVFGNVQLGNVVNDTRMVQTTFEDS